MKKFFISISIFVLLFLAFALGVHSTTTFLRSTSKITNLSDINITEKTSSLLTKKCEHYRNLCLKKYELKEIAAKAFATQEIQITRSYKSTHLKFFKSNNIYTAAVTYYFMYAESEGMHSIVSNDPTVMDSIPLEQNVLDDGTIIINYSRESFICPYTISAANVDNATNFSTFIDNTLHGQERALFLFTEDIPSVPRIIAREIEETYISQLYKLKTEPEKIIINGHKLSEWTDDCYLWNDSIKNEEDVIVDFSPKTHKEFTELISSMNSKK